MENELTASEALGLLAHVLQRKPGGLSLAVSDMSLQSGEWYVDIQVLNERGGVVAQICKNANTLERAIARSCLPALTAIGEAGEP